MKTCVVLLVIIFLFLVHIPYIPNGFTWLDHGDIEGKRTIISGLGWGRLFVSRFGETGFYRPVVTILNNVDYRLYNLWAPGYHLTNVIGHILVAIAAPLFIASFIPLSFFEKLVVMMVVGIHPIGFLPVGAISYRQELLVSLFTYLTVYFHRKIRNQNNKGLDSRLRGNDILAGLFFLCALFSKESALVFLPLLIIYWEIITRREKKQNRRIIVWEFVVIIIYTLLRRIAVPELWHVSSVTLPLDQAIGTRLYAVGKLILYLISPLTPTLSDATLVVSLFNPVSLITGLILIIGLVYILMVWIPNSRRFDGIHDAVITHSSQTASGQVRDDRINILCRQIAIIIALLLILLIPSFNLVPLPRFTSPHYGYIAFPAAAALLILLIRRNNKSKANKVWISACTGMTMMFIIISSYSAFTAGFRFKNDETLFLPDVLKDDHFLEGHHYLGDYYLKQNEYEKAEEHYEKALVIDQNIIAFVDKGTVVINLAGILVQQQKLDDADQLLEEAATYSSSEDLETIIYNRALIAYKQGRYGDAVKLLYSSGVWNRIEPKMLLVEALKKTGKVGEALEIIKKYFPELLPK